MKVREFEEGVEIGPSLFLISKTKVLYREGEAGGYTSKVGDHHHIFMADIDVDRRVWKRGRECEFINWLSRMWVRNGKVQTCGIVRTEKQNYHVISVDVLKMRDVLTCYAYLETMLPKGWTLDLRHLAIGILQGYLTLRISSKEDPRKKGPRLVDWTIGPSSTYYSLQHYLLLKNMGRSANMSYFPRPLGTAIDKPLDVVRYAI